MRLLMLYGVNCTKMIWEKIQPLLNNYEIDYVEYPHEITVEATKVEILTKWVYEKYHTNSYDAVIGHSLGGIVSLQLAALYGMKFKKIIYLDTNLKPAKEFYRNLMTPKHMEEFGQQIIPMFKEESVFYHPELFKAIQHDFDYTVYLKDISQKVFALYGDRGIPDYSNKISDLNLDSDILNKLEISFVEDSCHLMMIENPNKTAEMIKKIIEEKSKV